MEDIEIEEVDDVWIWQIKTKKLPQLCLPRNRYG